MVEKLMSVVLSLILITVGVYIVIRGLSLIAGSGPLMVMLVLAIAAAIAFYAKSGKTE